MTFIHEHITRAKAKASTLGTCSHKATSSKKTMSHPSKHTEPFVSAAEDKYYKIPRDKEKHVIMFLKIMS